MPRHARIQQETGATFIHPFDDPMVIAGQGTIGLEIMDDLPDVDTIVVPIGGGGLASGVAAAVKMLHPNVKVIGVQAAGAAGMKASIDAGHVVSLDAAKTIADGIAVKKPGELTFELCSRYLDEIVTVDDDEIAQADSVPDGARQDGRRRRGRGSGCGDHEPQV